MKNMFALLLLMPMTAMAGEGEVCQSPLSPMTMAPVATFNNDTEFTCPTAGVGTVQDLYKKGWRVVALVSQMDVDSKMQSQGTRWTLVIEKA